MIGIISDTHDNVPAIIKAVEIFKEKNVELVLHLGDIIAPITIPYFKGLNMKFIKGNNDGDVDNLIPKINEINGEWLNEISELNVDDKKLFGLCHGHNEEVLNEMINSERFDYVVTGHTHEKRDEKIGKTRVINPGTCYAGTKEHTIALLDLDEDKVEFIKIN